MRYVLQSLTVIGVSLFAVYTSLAQNNDSDSLSFIRSRKISADDLQKKRAGTFFTGIPDISSDPVSGFGFGLRANIFWNGDRNHELFEYAPYLAKLKVNAAYYTSNARELNISLDVPYYDATPWRLKIDFKMEKNPAKLYFGLTEKTLDRLTIPSQPSVEFSSYREYEDALKRIRGGVSSEPERVADVLLNRFSETEFMLNLKADYAIGDGRWRLMGGYEIQNLKYETFENLEVTAINPSDGSAESVPNGTSLLVRDYEQGLISGINGGWISILQTALIYDTRDFEPDPTDGLYFEIANEYSSSMIGSEFDFNKLFIQLRHYGRIPIGLRTVIASRIGIGNIFGRNAPFFEFQDQWSPDGSINALGGRHSLRGFRANRYLARAIAFANIEVRYRIADVSFLNQMFGLGVASFVDMGTVRDDILNMSFDRVKVSAGTGLRIAWNQSTVLALDVGFSHEDRLIFFGVGQIF